MPTKTSQTQSTTQDSLQKRLRDSEAADHELYLRLSRIHRDHLRPVGPIEQTLVETIIHNCFQIHHVQQAERNIRTFNSTSSLMNLGRLARYRAYLEHSTAKSLAKLGDIQNRRLQAKPAVMTAATSSSVSATALGPDKSAVQNEPVRLPIPRPIDQPASPIDTAGRSSAHASAIQFPSPIPHPTSPPQAPPQAGPDPQDC